MADPTLEQFDLTAVLHALSDPTRLAVVAQLDHVGEMSCGCLDVSVAKSTLSQHLRVLREAGVTHTRPDGNQRWLSIRREALDTEFPNLLDAVLAAHSRSTPVSMVNAASTSSASMTEVVSRSSVPMVDAVSRQSAQVLDSASRSVAPMVESAPMLDPC